MMKKYVPILILLAALLLTSCHVNDPSLSGENLYNEADAKLLGINNTWDYQIVNAHCEFDSDSGEMVCQRFDNGDSTYLQNLLASFDSQGWEYIDCVTSGEGRLNQTFIFRKESVLNQE